MTEPTEPPTVELQLHGSPAARLPGGPWFALAAREAALLAWLHVEGPTPRAPLAGRLWPGGDDAKARTNLRQTLLRLKRSAGPLLAEDERGLRLADGVAVLAADGDAPLLGTIEFDDAPELAAWLANRREAGQRERLRERLAAAREHLAQGRLDDALAAADTLLAADPAVEEAHRIRMEVFYLRGDRAAAVAAWDDCKHQLRSAFGIVPSAPTNELGRLILAGAPAAPAANAPRPLPAALRRPPQLVGRGAVLADIERALALGHGVVVAGVGGIGKSRLLAEVAELLAPAVAVGARPGDALLPGAVVTRLVQSALARFDPPLDDATRADLERLRPGTAGTPDTPALRSALEQRRVLASLARTLAACHERGMRLVVVDDVQFADDTSLAAIRVVLGGWLAEPNTPAALPLFGARGDELGPAAAALLALLEGSGRCTRFDLAPLAAADVRALLGELPLDAGLDLDALAAALLAQVGGNPAFVLESLKSLWLDGFAGWSPHTPLPVPATLLGSLRQRLQRLPDAALQLAQLAAVARGDFTPALAAAALQRTPLQLSPLLAALESAQVFDGPGFSHDLVAEAVQRSLPAALLPPLHRVVAEHLVAHGGAAPAIAHHLQAAGDGAAAAPWHLKAAQQARAAWQMVTAATGYEAAAVGLPDDDRGGRFGAWLGAARCWLWADRDDDALRALDKAAALANGENERTRLATVRAIWNFNNRRLGHAVAGVGQLIDLFARQLDTLDAQTLIDGVRVTTSTVAYGVDVERALAMLAAVQPRLEAMDGSDGLLALRTARGGLLHWASRPREAIVELDAAWQQAARDASSRVLLANQRMRVRHALGDLAGAIADGEWLLPVAAPLQLGSVFQADVMHVIAMVEVAAGRAAAGLARFDELDRRLRAAAAPRPDLFATSRTLALIAVGRLDEARDELARHPPAGRDGHGLQDLGYHGTQAKLALARGEPVAPWLALVAAAGGLPPGILLQREVMLAALQPPRGGDADALADLVERLRSRGLRGLQRVAEMAAARAALAAGRHAAAAAFARGALEAGERVDAWVDEPASAWLCAADVLAACGHAEEAAAAAAAGAAWVTGGAEQWADATHRDAWLHGNPVHRALLQRNNAITNSR